MTAEELIVFFDLKPLSQEGGYFRETYRSADQFAHDALPGRYTGGRHASTCIYYLVTPESFSAFHRLKSDEIYHFYLGSAVELITIREDGTLSTTIMGQNIYEGEQLQAVVQAGVWQALHLREGGEFALLACTVAPGFEFEDYEHGNWENLLRQFPDHHAQIMRLTRV